MTDTFRESVECPFCGRPNDAVTRVAGEGRPEPGSVILCAYCVQPGFLTDAGQIRRPTDDELVSLAADEGYVRAVRALVSMGGFGAFGGGPS